MVILRITFKVPKNHMLFPRFTNITKWIFPIIQIYEPHRHPVRFHFSTKVRESQKWKFLGMRKFTIQFFFFIFSFKEKNIFQFSIQVHRCCSHFSFLVNIFVVVDIYSKKEKKNREYRAKKRNENGKIFKWKIQFKTLLFFVIILLCLTLTLASL